MIYLDHAASTPMLDCAVDTLIDSCRHDFANPASPHKLGRKVSGRIEAERAFLLEMPGAQRDYDLYFTSSATESNNTVIKGIGAKPGDTVLVSEGDHPSLTVPALSLQTEGVEAGFIPMALHGEIDRDALLSSVNERTRLLILSHVNNQSGNIYDVAGIASEVRKKSPGVHIHVDGVQGFCRIPLKLGGSGIDSFSISSHKIGGPKGIAALLVRRGIELQPLILGGGQENGMRSSTVAAPLILSFAEAARHLSGRYKDDLGRVTALNRMVREKLKRMIPDLVFPFEGDHISPYILNIIIPGIPADIIVRHLELKDIFISTTSACSSSLRGESRTLKALGVPTAYHNNVCRISFSSGTTEEELGIFCDETASVRKELSELR